MRRVEADWWPSWHEAWTRDRWTPEYRNDPWPADKSYDLYWFDTQTGKLLWISEEDAAGMNEETRERIEAEPERYQEVPPLTHAEHHETFQAWLDVSPFVDDEVREACITTSIGGFFDTYDERIGSNREVRHRWEDYHRKVLRERAATWLRQLGVEVEWR